ncbi:hypothetical protein ATE68_06555 [Sphingopyxis sp. H038]|uniref:hypothetical protein n=1 Tax=unclassified Sphingopyxis TaxID=2614943 RepID=UPI00072FDEC9|nr:MULTISPECIES: hypothetical protein [unclassified Sphingopyxis]KTE02485.1 hypothetical protein ATE78_09095 [Sphingopyxis sp. H012]KTE06738.1 hypothetical protein ATE76_18280 [Sphingopyxis sp. H093]KTE11046.1 hypothetical protein ATE70_08795 [Sphingopyxis sp. H053]KTE30530.1 hypothetical protein ATE75_02200 [Sphingopyxis sp. H080]KTE35534.1 hypothetical protein ATE68_06555 [Sphingopyxis sp. H038]
MTHFDDHWTWKLWQEAASGRMESTSFKGWDFHILPGLSNRVFATSGGLRFGKTVVIEGLQPATPKVTAVPLEYAPDLPALSVVRCDCLSRRLELIDG